LTVYERVDLKVALKDELKDPWKAYMKVFLLAGTSVDKMDF